MNTITLLGSFIEITSKCDGHCPYCYNASGINGLHLDVAKIYSIIDELDDHCNLTLSGGEPLLHPHFIEILEHAFAKGLHKIRIITNGKHLYELNRCDLLAKCELQLTIESANPEIQEQYRGKGSFEILTNIKHKMLEYDNIGRVTARVNISHRNSDDIERIVEMCREWKFDVVRFSFLQKKGRALYDSALIDYDTDEASTIISRIRQMCTECSNSTMRIEFDECLPNKGCELMDIYNIAISPMITAKGNVYPCTKLTYEFCSLGNINDMSLMNIIASKKAHDLFAQLRDRWKVYDQCTECIWKNGCFKGCPATAYEKFGTIDHISDTCEYLRHIYHKKLFEKRVRK